MREFLVSLSWKQYVLFLAVLVAIGALANYAIAARENSYETAAVRRGGIDQEVLASGNVQSPTTASLHFEGSGELVALDVATGDTVQAGEVLAVQDTNTLEAQLQQAEAARAAQQAQLAVLQEGTRPEEIAVTQTQVENDVQALARTQATVANAIESAYTASDDAVHNKLDSLFNNPHSSTPTIIFSTSNSQLATNLTQERLEIEPVLAGWQAQVGTLAAAGDISGAETSAQSDLVQVADLLSDANDALNVAIPTTQVSSATIGVWLTAIAGVRANVNTAQAALTTAITAQTAASSTLAKDQKTLALQQAGSTASSIAAQQALVAEAQANVAAIQAQINNLEIIAPFDGVVTDTEGTVGENVTPTTAIVSLMPHSALEIKANVSEDNIVDVSPGEPVRIELDAFPSGTEFAGTVSEIDPAETLIGGAVYYQTTILFDQDYADVKPGMTANVWIQTGSSTDALLVPASALEADGASSSVDVLANGRISNVPVSVGLKGQDGSVQILSGLTEGQLVVTGTR